MVNLEGNMGDVEGIRKHWKFNREITSVAMANVMDQQDVKMRVVFIDLYGLASTVRHTICSGPPNHDSGRSKHSNY